MSGAPSAEALTETLAQHCCQETDFMRFHNENFDCNADFKLCFGSGLANKKLAFE
jgi:hypothetical protein